MPPTSGCRASETFPAGQPWESAFAEQEAARTCRLSVRCGADRDAPQGAPRTPPAKLRRHRPLPGSASPDTRPVPSSSESKPCPPTSGPSFHRLGSTSPTVSSGDHFWVFHKRNLSASSSLLTGLSRCYQPPLPTPFPSPLKAADRFHMGSARSHGFHRA